MSSQRDGVVSYKEVFYWADEVERAHHCRIHFEWYLVHKEGLGPKWDIRAVAKWMGVGGQCLKERGESAAYPHPDYQSPAGCMITLIYRLDRHLTEEADEAASQRAMPFSFG